MPPIRALERLLMKRGRLTYERNALAPLVQVRRELLGDRAAGPPRFLVRVDEFPHYLAYDLPHRYGIEMARRFHEVMTGAGVAHLMAIVPQLSADPLNPRASGGRRLGPVEIEHLRRMEEAGVELAQHGTTHRTRYAESRRHSELAGRHDDDLGRHLDRGLELLAEAGVRPRVLVPPFNRFDARQWRVLAERYAVICGGPESVRLLGFHVSPLFRDGAVYLPAYPPLYGTADEVLPAAERLIESAPGAWIPIVLHSGWEADRGWTGLERLAARIAPFAARWSEFLAAVDSSRPA